MPKSMTCQISRASFSILKVVLTFFIRYCTLQGSILSLTLENWLYLQVEAVEAEDKGVDCKAWSACGDRCQRPLRILLGNRCPYN